MLDSIKTIFMRKVGISWLIPLLLVALFPYFSDRFTVGLDEGSFKTADQYENLGIKDIVGQIKSELEASERERLSNKEVGLFHLQYLDLEMNFVVRRTSEHSATLKPEFIVVDNKTNLSSERIQKIKLHFNVPKPEKKQEVFDGSASSGAGDVTSLGKAPPKKD